MGSEYRVIVLTEDHQGNANHYQQGGLYDDKAKAIEFAEKVFKLTRNAITVTVQELGTGKPIKVFS